MNQLVKKIENPTTFAKIVNKHQVACYFFATQCRNNSQTYTHTTQVALKVS